MIIFKQSINKIFGDILGMDSYAMSQFYTHSYFIVLILALLETPLTLVKKMETLKLMALSGQQVSSVINPVGGTKTFPIDWFKAAAAVPNILLALSYQMNFFPIFKGMRKASDSSS